MSGGNGVTVDRDMVSLSGVSGSSGETSLGGSRRFKGVNYECIKIGVEFDSNGNGNGISISEEW